MLISSLSCQLWEKERKKSHSRRSLLTTNDFNVVGAFVTSILELCQSSCCKCTWASRAVKAPFSFMPAKILKQEQNNITCAWQVIHVVQHTFPKDQWGKCLFRSFLNQRKSYETANSNTRHVTFNNIVSEFVSSAAWCQQPSNSPFQQQRLAAAGSPMLWAAPHSPVVSWQKKCNNFYHQNNPKKSDFANVK